MNASPTLLTVATDVEGRSWTSSAQRTGPDGTPLERREASGTVEIVQVLRKDKDGKEKREDAPITDVELLGLGLRAALDLGQDWGEPCTFEADTRQNGQLKVSIFDWVRAGRLEEGEAGFVYAREAWAHVLAALRQEPPHLRVHWKLPTEPPAR